MQLAIAALPKSYAPPTTGRNAPPAEFLSTGTTNGFGLQRSPNHHQQSRVIVSLFRYFFKNETEKYSISISIELRVSYLHDKAEDDDDADGDLVAPDLCSGR